MENQEPICETYFEMEFAGPQPEIIHLMRSEILENEPTLDGISVMSARDIVLLYLQRLAVNPIRPIISAEIMIEAREAHLLIYNFIESLTLSINEEREWMVHFTFKDFIDGFEYVQEGREFIPPTQEEGYKVFNYFRNLIKSHFYNREAVRMAVEFYFIIQSPQVRKILEDQNKQVEEFKLKKPKSKKDQRSDVVKITPPAKFRRSVPLIEGSFRKARHKQVGNSNPLQLPVFSSIDQTEIDEDWFANRVDQRIALGVAEHKLIICISQELQAASRNTENPDEEDYYAGNADPNKEFAAMDGDQRFLTKTLEDGQVITQRTATVAIPLYKLTQAYIGRSRKANTSEKQFVANLALSFQTDLRKMMLVPKKTDEGFIDYDLVPMMRVALREPPGGQKPYLVLKLDPVFIDQIDKKFVEYPYGYLDKIYKANGGNQRLSDVVLPFLDYLAHLRANRNNKHYNPTIYIHNLYYRLAKQWVEDPKRGINYVKKRVDEAIKIALDINLLNKPPKEMKGKTGETMYKWDINFDWC
jgi:hypothetical protein